MSENGTGLEYVMLDIRDADGYNPDRREIDRFLRSGQVRQSVPPGGLYVQSGAFTIERRPGYWVHMKMTHERAGVDIYQAIVMYQLFFRGEAIGIMCQAGGTDYSRRQNRRGAGPDQARLSASRQQYRPGAGVLSSTPGVTEPLVVVG
jgi:hypothetical protein